VGRPGKINQEERPMKKRIVVGVFHDGYAPILVGGRKNVDRQKRVDDVVFVSEHILVVDVPETILGTTEEWDIIFNDRMGEALKGTSRSR
jgi:hypothetical protein